VFHGTKAEITEFGINERIGRAGEHRKEVILHKIKKTHFHTERRFIQIF
jgi:hypothetical protein